MEIQSLLFVGRRNAARSIMAETCFNGLGVPGWRAFSAGWETRDSVDRQAIAVLAGAGHATDTLYSKPVAIFTQPGAPSIRVCIFLDEVMPADVENYPAAREHWNIPDPSRRPDRRQACSEALDAISARIAELILSGRLMRYGRRLARAM